MGQILSRSAQTKTTDRTSAAAHNRGDKVWNVNRVKLASCFKKSWCSSEKHNRIQSLYNVNFVISNISPKITQYRKKQERKKETHIQEKEFLSKIIQMLRLADKYFKTVIKMLRDTKENIHTMNKKIGNLCTEIETAKKKKRGKPRTEKCSVWNKEFVLWTPLQNGDESRKSQWTWR